MFGSSPEEDREFLQLFSFICLLSFDVYLKKQMIEHMVDELASLAAPSDPKRKIKNKRVLKKTAALESHRLFLIFTHFLSFSIRSNTISYPSFP